MARRSKLTPKKAEELRGYIASGLPDNAACERAGIGTTTFYGWLQKAEQPRAKKELRDFRDIIKNARAEFEAVHLEAIGRAGLEPIKTVQRHGHRDSTGKLETQWVTETSSPPQWQASAWLLERRFPERYGLHIKARIEEQVQAATEDKLEAESAQVIDALVREFGGEEDAATLDRIRGALEASSSVSSE